VQTRAHRWKREESINLEIEEMSPSVELSVLFKMFAGLDLFVVLGLVVAALYRR